MMPPIFPYKSYCPLDCRCHGHLGSTNFIPSYNIPVNRTVPLVSSSPLEMSWFVRFVESQLGKCWHGTTSKKATVWVKFCSSEPTVDWDTSHEHLSWASCHCFEMVWEHGIQDIYQNLIIQIFIHLQSSYTHTLWYVHFPIIKQLQHGWRVVTMWHEILAAGFLNLDVLQRREHLQRPRGFKCLCRRCLVEEASSIAEFGGTETNDWKRWNLRLMHILGSWWMLIIDGFGCEDVIL